MHGNGGYGGQSFTSSYGAKLSGPALRHGFAVEADVAPDRIIASAVENNRVTRTRALCPYPKTARYQGSGDSNQAENFRCE